MTARTGACRPSPTSSPPTWATRQTTRTRLGTYCRASASSPASTGRSAGHPCGSLDPAHPVRRARGVLRSRPPPRGRAVARDGRARLRLRPARDPHPVPPRLAHGRARAGLAAWRRPVRGPHLAHRLRVALRRGRAVDGARRRSRGHLERRHQSDPAGRRRTHPRHDRNVARGPGATRDPGRSPGRSIRTPCRTRAVATSLPRSSSTPRSRRRRGPSRRRSGGPAPHSDRPPTSRSRRRS